MVVPLTGLRQQQRTLPILDGGAIANAQQCG
jgi:hypothetical protein